MKEQIVSLIRLQNYDNRIKDILNKKKAGPLRLQKLDSELNAMRIRSREQTDRLETYNKDRRENEQDIQEVENKIGKSDLKLSHIKSNKEYQAALKETEDLKRIKYKMEDKVLQFMEEIEDLEKICSESNVELDELRKKLESAKKEVTKELDSLDREFKHIEKKRRDFAQDIDEELARKYHFIKDHKGGKAIGPVLNGVCQSCHLEIPPQKYNELLRGNSLLACTNCDRFIYWGEDEYFQKV